MTVDPLTILHVLAPARQGGLENVVSALAAGHHARGHDVHVAAVLDIDATEHPLTAALESAKVPVHALRVATRAYVAERRALGEICRVLSPDVVHTHGYRADIVDSAVARRMGISTVTTVHGFTGGDLRNRLYEFVQVRTLTRFDAVVAVSRPIARLLQQRGVSANRVHTIANAWSQRTPPLARGPARLALGLEGSEVRLGFVGRLSSEKGADILLEAAALLDARVSVSFIGIGPQRDSLERRARELGLDNRVTWHGEVPDAARFLSAFDVMVLSSRTEGTPIILFETMAAGVPVVASAVGGIPDVVASGEAVLVPANDVEALASAIRQTIDDPVAAQRRASAARRVLHDRFRVEPWLTAYESVYRLVCKDDNA